MKYRLLHELPHDPQTCLGWLLDARGVEDIEGYVYPSKEYELSPYLLDNKREYSVFAVESIVCGKNCRN